MAHTGAGAVLLLPVNGSVLSQKISQLLGNGNQFLMLVKILDCLWLDRNMNSNTPIYINRWASYVRKS